MQTDHFQNSFIGRERELLLLDGALTDTLAGQGRLVLLAGEPGIGKTTLANQFSKQATKIGAAVTWGRCWEGAGAPPYWPLIQIIRDLIGRSELAQRIAMTPSENLGEIAAIVPELRQRFGSLILQTPAPVASDLEQARFRLFDSMTILLRNLAISQPLLLVIDDLHDADQASLLMLQFIARELKNSRVMLLGTYRDTEVRRSAALSSLIGELHREGSTIPLGGLSREEIGQFVETRCGHKTEERLIERLHGATVCSIKCPPSTYLGRRQVQYRLLLSQSRKAPGFRTDSIQKPDRHLQFRKVS